MHKTNELKKLIRKQLNSIPGSGKSYFRTAEKTAIYPHKVFRFENVDLNNTFRDDVRLLVDVWSKDANEADDIADAIEALFDGKNLPQEQILPTCYKMDRKAVDDEDRTIEHRQLRIMIQNYEREVAD